MSGSASVISMTTLEVANYTEGTSPTEDVASEYILGAQGASCNDACASAGRQCNPNIVTGNSKALFTQVGAKCKESDYGNVWWADDQPSFVTDRGDVNVFRCLGWQNVPVPGNCGQSHVAVRRLCRCVPPGPPSAQTVTMTLPYAVTVSSGNIIGLMLGGGSSASSLSLSANSASMSPRRCIARVIC